MNATSLIALGSNSAASYDFLRDYVARVTINRWNVTTAEEKCSNSSSLEDPRLAQGPSQEAFSSGYCQWTDSVGVARRLRLSSWKSWESSIFLRLDTYSHPYCNSSSIIQAGSKSTQVGPIASGHSTTLSSTGYTDAVIEELSMSRCYVHSDGVTITKLNFTISALTDATSKSVYVPPTLFKRTTQFNSRRRQRRRSLRTSTEGAYVDPDLVNLEPILYSSGLCTPLTDPETETDYYAYVTCPDMYQGFMGGPASVEWSTDSACTNPLNSSEITSEETSDTDGSTEVILNDSIKAQFLCIYALDEEDLYTENLTQLTLSPTPTPTASPIDEILLTATLAPTISPTNGSWTWAPTAAPTAPLSTPTIVSIVSAGVAFVIAGVAYVLVTSRKRQKSKTAEDLQESLPKGSTVTRRGTLNLLGMSLSVYKSKLPFDVAEDEEEDTSVEDTGGAKDATLRELDEAFIIHNPKSVQLGPAIGQGAFGRIYRGTYQGSAVAVKDVKTGPMAKESTQVALANEIRSLQGLQHPNIIRLYGAVLSPTYEVQRLVLELAEYSMDDVIARRGAFKRSGVTIVTLLQWMEQVCVGGQFMHNHDIVHMDLKPANILINSAWNVKIADFGSSCTLDSLQRKLANAGDRTSVSQVLPGSLAFMAPERWSSSRLSSSVDIYSFGMTVWQLLHSDDPFPNHWTLPVTIDAIQDGYRPEIDEYVPGTLKGLIEDCWNQHMRKRPSFDQAKEIISMALGVRSFEASSASAMHPPFEKGQHVWVWENMHFIGEAIVLENPLNGNVPCKIELTSGVIQSVDPNYLL